MSPCNKSLSPWVYPAERRTGGLVRWGLHHLGVLLNEHVPHAITNFLLPAGGVAAVGSALGPAQGPACTAAASRWHFPATRRGEYGFQCVIAAFTVRHCFRPRDVDIVIDITVGLVRYRFSTSYIETIPKWCRPLIDNEVKLNIETISLEGAQTVDLRPVPAGWVCGLGRLPIFDAGPPTPVAIDGPYRRLCGDTRRRRVPVCCAAWTKCFLKIARWMVHCRRSYMSYGFPMDLLSFASKPVMIPARYSGSSPNRHRLYYLSSSPWPRSSWSTRYSRAAPGRRPPSTVAPAPPAPHGSTSRPGLEHYYRVVSPPGRLRARAARAYLH